MKIYKVTQSELKQLGCNISGYTLCVYESGSADPWKGWIAANAGWTGQLPEPGIPQPTYLAALRGWIRAVNELSHRLEPQTMRLG